jgi:hypothetical protein
MGAIMPAGCALLPRHEGVTATIWRETLKQFGGKHWNSLSENIETIWRETLKQFGGKHWNNLAGNIETGWRETLKQFGGQHW